MDAEGVLYGVKFGRVSTIQAAREFESTMLQPALQTHP
jgi:hypothetical protein